ncbi:MAG UNVERIFIED_CONTAM: hypothetical protein LVT10_21340 [Anaerolineae bacterium]
MRLDLDRTLAQAFDVGHQDTPVRNLQEQVQAWARGVQVSPHYVFDQERDACLLRWVATGNRHACRPTHVGL